MPPASSKPLSAAFVKTVNKPGQYGDGRGGYGLRLRVRRRANGRLSKTWAQKLRIRGKTVQLGLGAYPIVTLAEARDKALANRRGAADGRDPREEPKAATVPTFAEIMEPVIALHQPTWKNPELEARIWRSSFRDYVLPTLGNKPLSEVKPADVLDVLAPLWLDKAETGRRVRRRIRALMRFAIARGYRTDNPAGDVISQALPRHRGPRRHYASLHYTKVGDALRKVKASRARTSTKLCFEFLVLCGVRSGEARLATWEEVEFETATWTIPAERMKANRVHRVPLSPRAVEILREAQELRGAAGLIFPSATGRAISNVTMSKMLKDLKIPAVPHGFRASLRVWAQEQTSASRAVMEAILAHRLGDAAEQAYARSELFEKRKDLMAEWSGYVQREIQAD